jgi:hypothetical protein
MSTSLLARRLERWERGELERADSGAFLVRDGARLAFLCDYCDDERERVVLQDAGWGGFLSVSVCREHVERAL